MKTEIVSANRPEAIAIALERLRSGEVIAIPTDTVYGVASDGFNAEAIEKLFEAKDRPRDKPIPLLLAEASDLAQVAVHVSTQASLLALKFWPGALTLVVRAKATVPMILRADGESVAVRVPDHPIPRNLARGLGRPLAATSANISGKPNPSTSSEVEAQLSGRIGLVVDAGKVGRGVASTVLDVTTTPPRVIRAGSLSIQLIEQTLGSKMISDADRN